MNRRPQSVEKNEALELSFPSFGETKNGVAFPSIIKIRTGAVREFSLNLKKSNIYYAVYSDHGRTL